MPMPDHARTSVRLAALADIHYSKSSQGSLQPLFAQIAETADVLVLCGDSPTTVSPRKRDCSRRTSRR